MRLLIARLDEKHKMFLNFQKTLKIFDEISLEKLNFYFLFKFVTKIELSEITPFI